MCRYKITSKLKKAGEAFFYFSNLQKQINPLSYAFLPFYTVMRLFFLSVLLISSVPVLSQRLGHIVLGDTMFVGEKITYDYSSMEIEFGHSKKIRRYTANDITEFQLKSGVKFLSRKIALNGEQRNVFLELLLEGPTKLLWLDFQGDRQLFLEVDSLEVLTSDNFRNLLTTYCLLCSYSSSHLEHVRLTKNAIRFIVAQYNEGKCPPIPFLSYGLSGHYSLNNFSLQHRSETHLMQANSWTMGIFLSIPVWKLKGAHFITDLRYERNTYSKALVSSPKLDEDIVLTLSGLNSLIAMQYGKRTNGFYTYVLGGFEAKYNVNAGSTLYQAIKEEQIIRTSVLHNTVQISPFFGYAFGAGINVHYNLKHYVAFELRRSQISGSATSAINTTSLSVRFNR